LTERTKLIKLRGDKSRQNVAYDLEITPQMLGAIERGDRTPSLPLAKKIADYYKVSVDDIFFEEEGNKMCPTGTDGQ
jgi:putative transcriptional regulator